MSDGSCRLECLERPIEEFMDQERFLGQYESTSRYPYHEEDHRRDPSGPRIGRPRSPVPRMGSGSSPRVSSDRDRGATGTSALHEKLPRPRREPISGRDNERTQRDDDQFDYNRLSPLKLAKEQEDLETEQGSGQNISKTFNQDKL